ncbi:MAG TPA: ATP-binding protein [Opitutaceae bacterium]|nr:ATP-binding protein [Opitutaceae bacterium]
MNIRSIRFRLTAWYASVLAAIFVLLGALFFIPLRRSIEGIMLETEARRARQIGNFITGPFSPSAHSGLAETIERFYAPERNSRFIRITRQDGTVLYLSGAPEDQTFAPAAVPVAEHWPARSAARRQALGSGPALLLAAFRAPAPGGGSYLVEVGTSSLSVDRMLSRLGLLFALALPVVLVVVAGGGYLLIRRALRPVDLMTGKAELISHHNLDERLPVAPSGDELERLAEALNRMLGRLQDTLSNSKRFLADASHELRTPLTVVRGELENLAQDPRLAPDLADRVGSLLEEAERLSKIVERLFALSRLDAGEAQSEWVRFDLAGLAAGTADQMGLLAEDKRISLTCEAEAPVPVEGDRARLKQVVVNLLDNAIKYTPEGGSIRLRVSALDGQAVLQVSDTGIGIPPEALPHIFERFYRVDQSRSRQPDGAGLGLAIIKSICKAHGGEIGVESAVGRGSTFRVRLPLAA